MSGSHVLSTFRVVHASCYGSVRCVTGCVAMRKLAKFWVAAVAAALGTMDANFDLRPARGQDARQIAYGRHLASECTPIIEVAIWNSNEHRNASFDNIEWRF